MFNYPKSRQGGTYYLPGAHSVLCDRTGFKVKSTQVRKQWDGLVVRSESWEPRHPQDLIRSVQDHQAVADPRPEDPDYFLTTNEVSTEDL